MSQIDGRGMTIAVCVDDRGGMLFNGRRLSRDRGLIADLLELAGDAPVRAAPFSAALFNGSCERVTVSDDFLDAAGAGDVCFVENADAAPYMDKVERFVIYRWNRDYPSDTLLDVRPEKYGLRLDESRDFAGSSHGRITREVYVR